MIYHNFEEQLENKEYFSGQVIMVSKYFKRQKKEETIFVWLW